MNKYIVKCVGWKIKMAHNDVTVNDRDNDKYKGFVCRFSLWKAN